MAQMEAVRDEARGLLSAVQNKIEELNNDIEAGKNTIIDALNSRATIKSKIGRFDTMMEQVNIRKAELTSCCGQNLTKPSRKKRLSSCRKNLKASMKKYGS